MRLIYILILLFIILIINVSAIPIINLNQSQSSLTIINNAIPTVQLKSINYTGNLSDLYVKKSGDTMTGNLQVPEITLETSTGGMLTFNKPAPFASVARLRMTELGTSDLAVDDNYFVPYTDNYTSLGRIGSYNYRFKNAYFTGRGNFGEIRATTGTSYFLKLITSGGLVLYNPLDEGIIVDSLRSFWAFKYDNDVVSNTGMYFDLANTRLSLLTYLGTNLAHVDLPGNLWASNNVQANNNVIVGNNLIGANNTDIGTHIVRIKSGENCINACARANSGCLMGMDININWQFQNCTYGSYGVGDDCLCLGKVI